MPNIRQCFMSKSQTCSAPKWCKVPKNSCKVPKKEATSTFNIRPQKLGNVTLKVEFEWMLCLVGWLFCCFTSKLSSYSRSGTCRHGKLALVVFFVNLFQESHSVGE